MEDRWRLERKKTKDRMKIGCERKDHTRVVKFVSAMRHKAMAVRDTEREAEDDLKTQAIINKLEGQKMQGRGDKGMRNEWRSEKRGGLKKVCEVKSC